MHYDKTEGAQRKNVVLILKVIGDGTDDDRYNGDSHNLMIAVAKVHEMSFVYLCATEISSGRVNYSNGTCHTANLQLADKVSNARICNAKFSTGLILN